VVVLIYNSPDQLIKSQASLITTVTAACLSVIVITLLNKVYEKIAVFLTDRGKWFSDRDESSITHVCSVSQTKMSHVKLTSAVSVSST